MMEYASSSREGGGRVLHSTSLSPRESGQFAVGARTEQWRLDLTLAALGVVPNPALPAPLDERVRAYFGIDDKIELPLAGMLALVNEYIAETRSPLESPDQQIYEALRAAGEAAIGKAAVADTIE